MVTGIISRYPKAFLIFLKLTKLLTAKKWIKFSTLLSGLIFIPKIQKLDSNGRCPNQQLAFFALNQTFNTEITFWFLECQKNKCTSYFQSKNLQKQEPGRNLFFLSLGALITRTRLKYLFHVGIYFTYILGAGQTHKTGWDFSSATLCEPKKQPTIWRQE